MNKRQLVENILSFSEFNIGDKVTITHHSQEPRKDDVVELGVVKKFGYNCTDELIIGVEIIKKYEPWLTYWASEKDRGQSHAINKGLERATGNIFAWLNSDDLYAPSALQRVGGLLAGKDDRRR